MINIVCQKCSTAVRISGDPDEMESLFGKVDKYRCPTCQELAEEVDAIDPAALHALDIHDLEPSEAYAAFHGLGFPEEQECSVAAVTQLFEQPIKNVKGDTIKGSTRAVLYSLEFADGTKMYLGSSPYGATVYRIQKPYSYVERVSRGE